ncbi:hypothetical protein CBS147311_9628 [Penicillium roqueforti]|nr:hypothetical protein CBS147311_9628 [Penicillium roqueforti]
MADPHAGGPESPPTNTQESTDGFTGEDLATRTTVENRKRTRSGDAFSPSDPAGRITTKEVWKLIGTLKDVIHHQTATIAATQQELQEVKHNQHVLQEQNEKLYDEAAVAAEGSNSASLVNPQRPERDQDCVRISTQRTFVDPRDNDSSDGNTFGRYLPVDTANSHIRTALQSDTATQDTQVAGIGTTKTGYIIRFKNTELAEIARRNTEWLHKLGNNTRLVKPQFGVVVYRTPTEEFDIKIGVA